jgi:hypothetical protein
VTGRRCPGCDHVFHRDQCTRKGPAKGWPVLDPATGRVFGRACGDRPACPCPYGACHTCGAAVLGASTLPLDDGSPEIDVDPAPDPAPDGLLAVWWLADGTLACRRLAPGEQPWPREWRGREHAHQLAVKEAAGDRR